MIWSYFTWSSLAVKFSTLPVVHANVMLTGYMTLLIRETPNACYVYEGESQTQAPLCVSLRRDVAWPSSWGRERLTRRWSGPATQWTMSIWEGGPPSVSIYFTTPSVSSCLDALLCYAIVGIIDDWVFLTPSQVAASTRNPNSSESPPLKAREMTKAVEVHTAF